LGSKVVNKFIEQKRYEPFRYGQNDCIPFVVKCLEAQGVVFPDRLDDLPYDSFSSSMKSLGKLLKKYGFRSINEYFDKFLERVPYAPPTGSVVRKGNSFGIVSARHGVFVDHDGLKFFDLDHTKDIYWKVK
jgi:hypothetical protein